MRILLALILCGMCTIASAQDVQTQPDTTIKIYLDSGNSAMTNQPSPLIVIKSQGKEYALDSVAFKNGIVKPESIEAITIIKKEQALAKYGSVAKSGAIFITLNDKKYPKAFAGLKAYLKEIIIKDK